MKIKHLWLITVTLNILYQMFFEQTLMQGFYSYLFNMFGLLFYYLSWIVELLTNKSGVK